MRKYHTLRAGLSVACAVLVGSTVASPLKAASSEGIGLDGAFFTDGFGAARTLSGDGSTVYMEGFGNEALNLRHTELTGTRSFPEFFFNISDIGFATSFDGSLAVAAVEDPATGFFDDQVVARFNGAGELVESFPLDPSLGGFVNNPVFIGRSDAILARQFNSESGEEFLARLELRQTPDGLVFSETEHFSLPQDARASNLGSNAAGQAVGFFEVSNAASNFDVADAGFYLVGPNADSFVQFSIDFSPVLDSGAVLESLFVQPEGISPGASFVILESRDSAEGSRSLLYDFEANEVSDVASRLPPGFSDALRALFPDESLSIPSFNPGQLVERIDAEGNLFGRVFNGDFDLVGTFVVTNTPATQVLDLETYLAEVVPDTGAQTTAAFLDQVELRELLTFSEEGNAMLVAGLDAGGQRDAFLLSLVAPVWYDGSLALGEGWRFFDWFKGFRPLESGWMFHARHGWMFVNGDDPASGLFLWDAAMRQWLWTNSSVYPWMFSFGAEPGWLFFFENSPVDGGPRVFARGGTGVIVTETDLSAD